LLDSVVVDVLYDPDDFPPRRRRQRLQRLRVPGRSPGTSPAPIVGSALCGWASCCAPVECRRQHVQVRLPERERGGPPGFSPQRLHPRRQGDVAALLHDAPVARRRHERARDRSAPARLQHARSHPAGARQLARIARLRHAG